MKFLEGKTPAERNKTIAALVLGFLAIVALAYTFLFSGSSKPRTTANTNANSNQKPVIAGGNSNVPTAKIQTPEQARDDNPFADLGPIPDNPFPPVSGDQPARNIFAFYEPPPPAPPKMIVPSPVPQASPVPVPTPPIFVQYVNPQAVYASQANFAMEVGGDKFTPDTKVFLNGIEVPTQFQTAQRLTAQVSSAMIAQPGQASVVVRAGNGDQSNAMMFNVQAPPVPNYNFVGLVARKRFNNDTAMLQEKSSKAYQNVRLGETVGRFKVVSISVREIVMQDTQLNFRHSLRFVEDTASARSGAGAGAGGRAGENPNNGFPTGFDPNPQIQYQSIPGIPGQYVQPQIQPMPQPSKPNNDEDDGDN